MIKVKIFRASNNAYIENEINAWLSENNTKINILNIIQSESAVYNTVATYENITISIFYSEV